MKPRKIEDCTWMVGRSPHHYNLYRGSGENANPLTVAQMNVLRQMEAGRWYERGNVPGETLRALVAKRFVIHGCADLFDPAARPWEECIKNILFAEKKQHRYPTSIYRLATPADFQPLEDLNTEKTKGTK